MAGKADSGSQFEGRQSMAVEKEWYTVALWWQECAAGTPNLLTPQSNREAEV